MSRKRRVSDMGNFGDKSLEQALSDWYHRGQAHGPDSEHWRKEGEWGGTVYYIYTRKTRRDSIQVYIDFGSIKNKEHAEAELEKIIARCGYVVIKGDVLASDGTQFEIKKIAGAAVK